MGGKGQPVASRAAPTRRCGEPSSQSAAELIHDRIFPTSRNIVTTVPIAGGPVLHFFFLSSRNNFFPQQHHELQTLSLKKSISSFSYYKYRRGITPNGCRWALNPSLGGMAMGISPPAIALPVQEAQRVHFNRLDDILTLFRRLLRTSKFPQYHLRAKASTSVEGGGVSLTTIFFFLSPSISTHSRGLHRNHFYPRDRKIRPLLLLRVPLLQIHAIYRLDLSG